MFKTILCAIDGSDCSTKAIGAACDLSVLCESQLHLIHASDYRNFLTGLGVESGVVLISQEEFEKPRREILKAAKKKADELGCLSIETHFVSDLPARAITEKAKEINADVIVMGSKGHSDIASLLIGSTTHKVCNSAKCACLVVR